MIRPVVNLNGTAGADLLQQLQKAVAATTELKQALRMAAPHGRDYQTAPEGAYGAATATYTMHMRNLEALSDELGAAFSAVCEQLDAKAARWRP